MTLWRSAWARPSFQEAPFSPRCRVYPAATRVGGRAPESFAQWWALPFEARFLSDDVLVLKLRWTGDRRAAPILYADLSSFVTRGTYHGPSFGEATRISMHKLKYDGAYRFMTRRPLRSLATRSFKNGREMFRQLRIRLVSLTPDLGGVRWRTDPVTGRGPTRLGFEAISGVAGDAELVVCGRDFQLKLRDESKRSWEQEGVRLQASPLGTEEGRVAYELLLAGDCVTPGLPVVLEVRYLANLEPAHKERDRFSDRFPRRRFRPARFRGSPKTCAIGRTVIGWSRKRSSHRDGGDGPFSLRRSSVPVRIRPGWETVRILARADAPLHGRGHEFRKE